MQGIWASETAVMAPSAAPDAIGAVGQGAARGGEMRGALLVEA